MSKAKRKRPEDDVGVGTRASTRNRGGTAGGASATRPDGGADGGANFHAGGVEKTNSAAGASARSRNRGGPRAPKGRKQRERTWRDLSQNALYDIVRRLDGPRAAKTKRRDLIARLETCVAELVACANKLIQVAARIEEHLAHAASTNPSFRIERDALREGMARLEALAREHVRRHARDDPRTLSSDKIVRAKINARLVAASLPILAAFLRDSVCEACPRATIAACDAFEALRVEVQLRTSVRVYREMPALRKTLYDGSVTKELAAELVTRVFGEIEKPNDDGDGRREGAEASEAAARRGERRSGDEGNEDDGGDGGGWVDGSSRIAPPPFVVNALFSACAASGSSVCFANQTLWTMARPRGGEDEGESSEAARTWAALWGETHDVAPAEGSGRGGGKEAKHPSWDRDRFPGGCHRRSPPQRPHRGASHLPSRRRAGEPFRRKRNIPRKHPRKHPRERWALSRAPAPRASQRGQLVARLRPRRLGFLEAIPRGARPVRRALDPRQRPRRRGGNAEHLGRGSAQRRGDVRLGRGVQRGVEGRRIPSIRQRRGRHRR